MVDATSQTSASLAIDGPSDGVLSVRASGRWTVDALAKASISPEERLPTTEGVSRLVLDVADVEEWDSGLVTFALNLHRFCDARKIGFDGKGLPAGASRLLDLAVSGQRGAVAPHPVVPTSVLADIGSETAAGFHAAGDMLGFFGESLQAVGRWIGGRSRMRMSDLYAIIEECGPRALPIVTLINFLIGMIMAFVGAVQLQAFGAQIFVANLVGIAMVRELGPVMTAIVLAGRTGAAFAAQLGTMTVNEEIAALRTVGVPPIDFLVLPRMVALVIMVPLLVIYANIVGMLGGLLIGMAMLDISFIEYFNQTAGAVSMTDWAGGLIKAGVFGVIVAVAGCMRGMQCGRSASDVGIATTSAVVTSIVFIIILDATLTVFYTVLGI